MKRETFVSAVGGIDEKYIEEALESEALCKKKNKARAIVLRVLIAAAVVALAVGIPFGVYAAAEAREYKTALTFFSENELDSAGLTREELKSVKKDIESGSFSLEVTREVLVRSLDVSLLDASVTADSLTAQDLKNVWLFQKELPEGFDLTDFSEAQPVWYYDNEADKGAVVAKYEKGEKVFSLSLGRREISGITEVSDGVLVYGNTENGFYGYAAKISNDGKLLWEDERSRYPMRFEFFDGAFEGENGRAIFIGTCRRSSAPEYVNSLSFAVYDKDGREVLFTETVLPGTSADVTNIYPFENEFLVQLYRSPDREKNSVVRVNVRGEVVAAYAYKGDEKDYFITDAVRRGTDTLVLATAVNRPTTLAHNDDISEVLDEYIASRHTSAQPTIEELTEALRAGVQAKIISIGADGSAQKELVSIDGVIALRVERQTDRTVLVAAEPTAVVFLPETSVDYFGSARVVRYTLNADGTVAEKTATDEYIPISWKPTCTAQSIEDFADSDGLKFRKNKAGDGYELVGIGDCADKDIVVPAAYKGLPVTAVARRAFWNDCQHISSVRLPEGLRSIGAQAFGGCYEVTVYLPASLREYDFGAFECGGGITLRYRGTLEDWLQVGILNYGLGRDSSPEIAGERTKVKALYLNGELLKTAVIPEGVQLAWQFLGIGGLESVTLSARQTIIYESAFKNCVDLKTVTLPKGLEYINGSAFENCAKLEKCVLPKSLQQIGASAFKNSGLYGKITIPEGCKVGSYAFHGCLKLHEVVLPDGLEWVAQGAFEGCTGLQTVTLPRSLVGISSYAFDGCTALEKVIYSGFAEDWAKVKVEGEPFKYCKFSFGKQSAG